MRRPRPYLSNHTQYNSQGVIPHYYSWSTLNGKTFLYWFGAKPRLAIADPDLIKEILIRNPRKSTPQPWQKSYQQQHRWWRNWLALLSLGVLGAEPTRHMILRPKDFEVDIQSQTLNHCQKLKNMLNQSKDELIMNFHLFSLRKYG